MRSAILHNACWLLRGLTPLVDIVKNLYIIQISYFYFINIIIGAQMGRPKGSKNKTPEQIVADAKKAAKLANVKATAMKKIAALELKHAEKIVKLSK